MPEGLLEAAIDGEHCCDEPKMLSKMIGTRTTVVFFESLPGGSVWMEEATFRRIAERAAMARLH